MKYFRFAFMSIYDNIKVNILMIVEILVILLGVNIIVGGYNNRNMLYKPYYDLLNNFSERARPFHSGISLLSP